MISLYSLIWTVIVCTPVILVIFFLQRKTSCLIQYGITFLMILSTFCFFRMIVPIEMPKVQKVISDPLVFPFLMKMYSSFGEDGQDKIEKILVCIWIAGGLISFIQMIRASREADEGLKRWCRKDEGRAERILKKIAPNCSIEIYYSLATRTPLLKNLWHPIIYLPEKDYSNLEMEFILMHEYTHWKRKDLWKKILTRFLCVVFWWNPLVHLFANEVSRLIEMACDEDMVKRYRMEGVLNYLDTLCYMAGGVRKKLLPEAVNILEFTGIKTVSTLKQRFFYLLEYRDSKVVRRTNLLVLCLSILWILASYYFILQPKYEVPVGNLKEQGISVISNEKNAYLKKKKDGTYVFCFEQYMQEVEKEEVQKGLYDAYPIVKEK